MSTETPAVPSDATPTGPPGIVGYVVGLIRTKGLRYVLVSVVNVLVGGGLLVILQHWMDPVEANIVGVAVSAIPAYYMNRAWVWGKRGKSHWKKEVLPFWIFTGLGLLLSTVAIHFAQDHTTNRFVILFVQLCAFGVLWVVRFFVLDRLFHVEVFEDDTPDEI
jgi:putative flippase GtrA